MESKPLRLPYGWTKKEDSDGSTFYTNASGTIQETIPTTPIYVTTEKVQQWLKLYDTTQSKFYYANSFTGEHVYVTPPLYFKQLKDKLPFPDFQKAAVSIQCVARIRQSNIKVNCKRAINHQKFAGAHARYIKTFHPHHHTYYWCNPKENKYIWEQPQSDQEYDFSSISLDKTKYPKWLRLWDPSHRQHYFYDTYEGHFQYTKPPEWNAAMWAFGFRSGLPPLIKAAVAVQTRYRKRTTNNKIAKERKARENMSAAERRKYLEQKAIELATKKRQMVVRREREREANERAGLSHEEALQRVRGDKFWGQDVAQQAKAHRIEVQKHIQEKKLKEKEDAALKKKEAVERRQNMKANRKDAMKRELIEEADMQDEEVEQRNYGDSFWGVDRQERDRRKGCALMVEEDYYSRARENREELSMMHERWAKELSQNKAGETLSNATADLRRRGNYMDIFYDSHSSDDVLKYVWPGSQTLMRRNGIHSENSIKDLGFGMPDVYSQKRLNAPASIFHALNPLKSAPPAAARDFLLDVHQGKGFKLLPHLHHCHNLEIKNGAVPPEMVTRSINSRRMTASRSLMSPSRAEAKRMRAKDKRKELKQTRRKERKAKRMQDQEESEEESEASLSDEGINGMQDTRDISTANNRPEDDEGMVGEGGSAILEASAADVRGVLSRKNRKTRGRNGNGNGKKKKKKKSIPGYLRPKSEGNQKKKKNTIDANNSIQSNHSNTSAHSPGPPPPPPAAVVVEFSIGQLNRMKEIFALMDADQSGYVDQHEMMIALRTNRNVIKKIEKSKLLSPLLTDPNLSRKFMEMQPKNSSEGMSINEFINFMQDNSSDTNVVNDAVAIQQEEEEVEISKAANITKSNNEYNGKTISADSNNDITPLLRRVFKLIDTNSTGTMGRREFLMSLKGVPDIRDFVAKQNKLKTIFSSKTFKNQFDLLNDPCNMDDFVELGIAIQKELGNALSIQKVPMTKDEIEHLTVIINECMGDDVCTKSKLGRLLLSTKISGKLIKVCPNLINLLKPRTFRKLLNDLDTDNDKSISPNEVVKFCVGFDN